MILSREANGGNVNKNSAFHLFFIFQEEDAFEQDREPPDVGQLLHAV